MIMPNADSIAIPPIMESKLDAINLDYLLCVFHPKLVVERRSGIVT